MPCYNRQQRSPLRDPTTDEKSAFQSLIASELKTKADFGSRVEGLKANLNAAQKQSSATLLRKKLKGHIDREWNEI